MIMKYLHLFTTKNEHDYCYHNTKLYTEPWIGYVKSNNHITYNDKSKTIVNYNNGNTKIYTDITAIEPDMFKDKLNIKSVQIGNTVTNIQPLAFCNFQNLTNVIIPQSILYIGHSAFQGCNHLKTNIIIPNQIKTIYYDTFRDCKNITNITLNDNIETLGDVSFGGTIIDNIILPKHLNYIGNYCFNYCSKLNNITCLSLTPPKVGNYPFYGVPQIGILHHPKGSDYSSWEKILPTSWTFLDDVII